MRFTTLLAAAVLAAGLFHPRAAPAGERVVYVYTWEGYFSPEAIEEFERRRDCSLDFTYYDSNDAMFEVELAKEGLRNGELAAIQAYSGDADALMRDNPDIDFFVPAEGSALNADVLAIMGDSKNVFLAHAFLDFFLEADIARMNMEYTDFIMPNAEAMKLMAPAWRASPARSVPPDILDKCEVIMDVGNARDIYDEVWAEVLLGNG